MLREIRNSFLFPRLTALRYTTASNAVTTTLGVGCATITSAATGSGVLRWTRAFSRRPIVVASADLSDIAAGGFVSGTANTFPTSLGHTCLTVNSSAAADDGTAYVLALGYDSRDSTRYNREANVVRSDFDQGRLEPIRINTAGSGSVTINSRAVFRLVRNGTGDVTLTLRSAFSSRFFSAVATAVGSTGQIVQTRVTDASTVQIRVFTNGGSTPADGIVNLILFGDSHGNGERTSAVPAVCSQRKSILFGYSVVYAAGAPTFDFNSGDATLTNTATGRVTFTFLEKFRREPIVVAMPIANSATQCCTIDNSSATAFEVKNFSAANSLANPSNTAGFQLIGVGFDDPSEY